MRAVAFSVSAFSLVCACGGSPPPAAAPTTTEKPAAPEPSEPASAGDAGAAADAGGEAKQKPEKPKARHPQPSFDGEKTIETTVGTNGAVFHLGKYGTLQIPEGAVEDGVNIRFSVAESSVKGGPGRLGTVFELAPKLASVSDGFILELALPPGTKEANLAYSQVETKGQNEVLAWHVMVPKVVDAERNVAFFEFKELPGGWIHFTSKKP